MVSKKEIEEIGNYLIKKANLEDDVKISFEPPKFIQDANCFYVYEKTIYCKPFASFFEFNFFIQKLPLKYHDSFTFLEFQKIVLSHEVGHALQTDLIERINKISFLATEESLNNINSLEELLSHVEKFKNSIIDNEKEAWDNAWDLVKDECDIELFEFLKDFALKTYINENLLNDINEFRALFEFFTGENNK